MEIGNGIATFATRNIHQMTQHTRTLDMAQEIVSKPRALRRAFDKSGDIRRHERFFVVAHYAEIRRKRGEMIVCNLGSCRGNFRKQGAFSHVREAHEADVGNDFHFQNDVMLFDLFALLREVGRVSARRRETYVAFPAVPAAGD